MPRKERNISVDNLVVYEFGDLIKSLSTCALTSAAIERKRETSEIVFFKSKQAPVYFYEIRSSTNEIRFKFLSRSRRSKKCVIDRFSNI